MLKDRWRSRTSSSLWWWWPTPYWYGGRHTWPRRLNTSSVTLPCWTFLHGSYSICERHPLAWQGCHAYTRVRSLIWTTWTSFKCWWPPPTGSGGWSTCCRCTRDRFPHRQPSNHHKLEIIIISTASKANTQPYLTLSFRMLWPSPLSCRRDQGET